LFERHYNIPERPGVAKVMLDTQYRMHRDICEFSSTEFYQGKLRTAIADDTRPLAPRQFPWPSPARKVFIQCSSPEDLGRQSKSNKGQVGLCRRVCELLSSPPETRVITMKAASCQPFVERSFDPDVLRIFHASERDVFDRRYQTRHGQLGCGNCN